MENIQDILFPDTVEKKTKKPLKKVLDTKERLSRTNRTVTCAYCLQEKILNPDQYQLLYDIWEDEGKIEEEFMCKGCEVAMNQNPVQFWYIHGNGLEKLCSRLKDVYTGYRNSTKTPGDAQLLQRQSVDLLREYNIVEPNFEFIVENQLPVGMKIKNVPFTGTINLKVYETTLNRIKIEN